MKIIFLLPFCVFAQPPNYYNRDYAGQNMDRELTGSFPHPRPIGKSIGNYPQRLTFPGRYVQARQPRIPNIGMVPPPSNPEFEYLRENFNPSAGMNAYWGEEDDPKMKMKQYIEQQKDNAEAMYRNSIRTQMTPKPRIEDTLSPKVDNYKAPIRWVPINSNKITDGLARVTDSDQQKWIMDKPVCPAIKQPFHYIPEAHEPEDPKTGQNIQYVINGTIYVPIEEYNAERFELNVPTTHNSVVRAPSIDFSKVSLRDWLVHEMVKKNRIQRLVEPQCDGDGCQARCDIPSCQTECDIPSCQTECSGDTCAAGCTGNSCFAFCEGPGCKSMCIGQECVAECEGLSCESRCLGVGCSTTCRGFSCYFVMNGEVNFGGGVWQDHYPQYDEANINPSGY